MSGNALGIHIELSTSESLNVALYSAEYVGPDGQQVSVADSVGPDSLRSGASSIGSVYFLATDPGGQLYFEVFGDDFSTTYEFALPVPA